MKTTLDLPDDLLIEAKGGTSMTIDADGLPCLKREGDTVITTEMIRAMMDEQGI